MSNEQDPLTDSEKEPRGRYGKRGEAYDQLASYVEELGFLTIGDADQPPSFAELKDFRESLTPEQRKKLEELEAAYYTTE